MKKIGKYFVIGCVIAVIGMFFSEACGSFFNGMDYGSACVLGIGMYLCVVVVICTGMILSKIEEKKEKEDPEEKEV